MPVVEVERRDRVTLIALNRPERRNALTHEMNRLIRDAFEAFRGDDDAWVAVLCSSGADVCAGVDLGETTAQGRGQPYRGWDQVLSDGLRTEMLLSRLLAGTEDLSEGHQAFRERRSAVWSAR